MKDSLKDWVDRIDFEEMYGAARALSKKSAHLAFPSSMRALPEFRKLVALGKESPKMREVLYILLHYFPHEAMMALAEITYKNPVKKENRGNLDEARRDWIAYGEKMGHIS